MTEGDVYFFNTPNSGDVSIKNGVMSLDSGLSTSVYISLFSVGDWWGNEVNSAEQKIKSELNKILDRKLNNQTRLDAIEFSKKSLAWMLDQNIVASIEIEATIPEVNILFLELVITKPDGTIINMKYEINWEKQLSKPIS